MMTPAARRVLRWIAFAIACAGVLMFAYERSTHASFGGIDIKGSAAFRARTIAALQLLRSKSPSDFEEIRAVVTQVREDARSGTDVQTGRVTIAAASSLNVSLAWYASVLAHEARHARLYQIERKHREGDAVFAAEVDCIKRQLDALRKVGGTERELAWLTSKLDGRYPDVDHDGKYTWRDYYERKW